MKSTRDLERIPILEILPKLLQHWYFFAGAIALALMMAHFYVVRQDNIFQVRATILMDAPNDDYMGSERFMKEAGMFIPKVELEDEIGILTSFSLIEKTLRHLEVGLAYYHQQTFSKKRVYKHLPFKISIDSSHVQLINLPIFVEKEAEGIYRITAEGENISVYDIEKDEIIEIMSNVSIDVVAKPGRPIDHPLMAFTITPDNSELMDESGSWFFTLNSLYQMVGIYRNSLIVNPVDNESNLLELSTTGPSVEHQKHFLNTLMAVYIQEEIDRKNEDGVKMIQFIDEQLYAASDSLRHAENKLESFRSSSNIIDISTTAGTLNSQQNELEQDLANLQSQNNSYRYILDNIKNQSGSGNMLAPSSLEGSDPILTSLIIELQKLNQEKAALELTTKKGNPQFEILQHRIGKTEETLREHVENMVETSKRSIEDVRRRLGQVEGKIRRIPRSERQLTKINRDFSLIDNVYQYLLEKKAEAGLAMANTKSSKKIVDKARLAQPKPISPNRSLIYGLALLFGFGLPFGAFLVREIINDKIDNTEDVALNTGIPTLGIVVKNTDNVNILTPEMAHTPLAESFRSVRVRMQYLGSEKRKKIIGVSSTWSGEGKSFCSANLASTFAQSGKKTILVDLDLRKPSVAEYYSISNKRGITNYLMGGITDPSELIQSSQFNSLDILAAGPPVYNPIDLLESPKFIELLDQLKKQYEYIILDTPPIGQTPDYIVIKNFVDFTIFIVRHNFTKVDSLTHINELYEGGKIQELGILINGVEDATFYGYGQKPFSYQSPVDG